jgi:hypothetical protein
VRTLSSLRLEEEENEEKDDDDDDEEEGEGEEYLSPCLGPPRGLAQESRVLPDRFCLTLFKFLVADT